jgi:hypothetical protein
MLPAKDLARRVRDMKVEAVVWGQESRRKAGKAGESLE